MKIKAVYIINKYRIADAILFAMKPLSCRHQITMMMYRQRPRTTITKDYMNHA